MISLLYLLIFVQFVDCYLMMLDYFKIHLLYEIKIFLINKSFVKGKFCVLYNMPLNLTVAIPLGTFLYHSSL